MSVYAESLPTQRTEIFLAAMIIDIDHFKSINDTWGHDVGDEAIVALTQRWHLELFVLNGDDMRNFCLNLLSSLR